jgi:hypothetical protein
MELKELINSEVAYELIMSAKMRHYAQLQEAGKLNIISLVMHIEKVDEYTAIESCLSILKECSKSNKELAASYEYLKNIKETYRRHLPRKIEGFYRRLERKLERLEKERFTFKNMLEWERHYTNESTLKRWVKKLQDWGYIELWKKDKLTGYQYKLRFKIEVNL